jgi:hypothetical protein
VSCVSFSTGGKLLATGCDDHKAYTWGVSVIVRGADLDELLLDSNVSCSFLISLYHLNPLPQNGGKPLLDVRLVYTPIS